MKAGQVILALVIPAMLTFILADWGMPVWTAVLIAAPIACVGATLNIVR